MPITVQGFEARTLEEVKDVIDAAEQGEIVADLDVDPDQPLGQINAIMADEISEVESGLAVAYLAHDRGSAEGFLLDNLGDFQTLPRLPAQGARVIVRVQLMAGSTLYASDEIYPDGETANRWHPIADFTAPADGFFFVTFEATNDTQSVPASVAWNFDEAAAVYAAANFAPSSVARVRESDEDYRARQASANARAGSGANDSLAADLLDVEGVRQAFVYENPRSFEVDGLPPHSFEAVIFDGPTADASDDAIAQVIWDSKPPGSAYAFGLVTATAYDRNGQPRLINFSRAQQLRALVNVTVQVLPGWQSSQEQALREAILAAWAKLRSGEDMPALKTKSVAIAQPYAYDVAAFSQGIYPGPYADTAILVSLRQIATLADADLTITIEQLAGVP